MQSSSSPPLDSLLSLNILRNLPDRSYERRKVGALELEHTVKSFIESKELDKVRQILKTLKTEFAESPQSNRKKGALIGFAAVAIALHESPLDCLDEILPPVLEMLYDEDSRVRYYACEALYNVSKVSRGSMLKYFAQVFKGLCALIADVEKDVRNAAQLLDRLIKDIVTESDRFNVEQFIPLLKENIQEENPYVRQLVVGWITVLDSVPDIDMLEYLPEFLEGLLNMLADNLKDIKQQVSTALDEFLREIKESFKVVNDQLLVEGKDENDASLVVNQSHQTFSLGPLVKILVDKCQNTKAAAICRVTSLNWLLEFIEIDQKYKKASVEAGGLIPLYGVMVKALLTCISDEESTIRSKAEQVNTSLLQEYGEIDISGFNQSEIVKSILENSIVHLPGGSAPKSPTRTRIAALKWISTLLLKNSKDVSEMVESLYPSLFETLSEEDDNVLNLDLRVLAKISSMNKNHFHLVLKKLVNLFSLNRKLLETRGNTIIRQLSVLLNGEAIYRSMSQILLEEPDLEFASIMVSTLNLILLTSSELFELREMIKKSLMTQTGRELFTVLYRTWCFNPVSTLSLCLLSQAYELACALVFEL